MRNLTRVVTAACLVGLAAVSGAVSSVGATSPSPIGPAPFAIEPMVALTGHAGNGIGVYLSGPYGPDRTWIFSDIPSNAVDMPDWSPDGRRIAVEAGGDDDELGMSIWIGDADDTDVQQVAACEALPCMQLAMPAWSPDGQSLALVRYDIEPDGQTWGTTGIESLDLATGERRSIVETIDARTSFAYPRWARDGRSIVLEIQTYSEAGEEGVLTGSAIAIVDTAGPSSQTPRMITQLDGFGAHPDWSPDGTRIVFGTYGIESFQTGGSGPSNLYTVAPDGSGLIRLTSFPAGGDRAGHASWTPDGTQIIFTRIEGTSFGGWGSRFVSFIDADGSNLRSIRGYLGTFPRLQPVP